MMRKLFLAVTMSVLMGVFMRAHAQEANWHLMAGGNYTTFLSSQQKVFGKPGISLGIERKFRMSEKINLVPGIFSSWKSYKVVSSGYDHWNCGCFGPCNPPLVFYYNSTSIFNDLSLDVPLLLEISPVNKWSFASGMIGSFVVFRYTNFHEYEEGTEQSPGSRVIESSYGGLSIGTHHSINLGVASRISHQLTESLNAHLSASYMFLSNEGIYFLYNRYPYPPANQLSFELGLSYGI